MVCAAAYTALLRNEGGAGSSGDADALTEGVSVPEPDETEKAVITLAQDGTGIAGSGASVNGNTVTIKNGGTYRLSGTLTEGQVVVDAGNNDTVILILDGVDITNTDDAAIYVENAEETCIYLEEGSENCLQSGEVASGGSVEDESDEDTGKAAVYARDDLSVAGQGTLSVFGYINNGIHTSNDLVIAGGTIVTEAVNNGIKGKDSVTIIGGSITIVSGGDGIKSDDETGEGYGVIAISGGTFDITSSSDGIQAETLLQISGGDFNITTSGGSAEADFSASGNGWGTRGSGWDMASETETSTKGIKCSGDLEITGGTFAVDSLDDAIHSNAAVSILGGTFTLASGDDGVHGDDSLNITDGEIEITASYEGLEANCIIISGGEINITASDDGINANGGDGSFGFVREDSDSSDSGDLPELTISGGTITVNASGDGLDSNGNITIEDGTIIVNGPENDMNGAIDSGSEYGGTVVINGGTVLALGSSGMAETFSSSSAQCAFLYTGSFDAGAQIEILDSAGNTIYEYTAVKRGGSIVFSSSDIVQGNTYTIRIDGEDTTFTQDSVSTSTGNGTGNGNIQNRFGRF